MSALKETKYNLNEEIKKTLEFLKKFDTIKYNPDQTKNKLVFLIGATGTGKSVIGQFLSGKTLKAVQKGHKIVIEGRGIGDNPMDSFTIHPELLKMNDYYLVDCPGFGDTRSPSTDIAATLLTKKMLEMTKEVKFLLIMRYNDVVNGIPGHLRDTITYVNSLLGDVTKFDGHIGLIANKMRPQVNAEEEVSQKKAFLEIIKQSYESSFDKTVEILTKDGRTEFFHLATKAGDLSNNQVLVEDKGRILNLVEEKLGYFHTNGHNFGLTIKKENMFFLNETYLQVYSNIQTEILTIGVALANELNSKNLTKFYNIVEVINELKYDPPRSNLLQSLHHHRYPELTIGLAECESIFESMKELPPYLDKEKENSKILEHVTTFKESTIFKLQTIATALYDSEKESLKNCMIDVLKDFKTNSVKAVKRVQNEYLIPLVQEKVELMATALAFDSTTDTVETLLKLLNETQHKKADNCLQLEILLKDLKATDYVSTGRPLNLSDTIRTHFDNYDETTIQRIGNYIWTNWEVEVSIEMGKLATLLTNSFQNEVTDKEQEDRQKKLKTHYPEVANLQTLDVSYPEFYDKFNMFRDNFGKYLKNSTKSQEMLKKIYDEFDDVKRISNKRIRATSEKRYQWAKNFQEAKDYFYNSASSTPSFINDAVHWIKGQVVQLIGHTPTQHYTKFELTEPAGASVAPTIMLLDLIVRKFTKTKTHRWREDSASRDLDAQAHAINMIDEYERLVIGSDHQVDFPALQKDLVQRIRTSDGLMTNVRHIRDELLMTK